MRIRRIWLAGTLGILLLVGATGCDTKGSSSKSKPQVGTDDCRDAQVAAADNYSPRNQQEQKEAFSELGKLCD
jgi:hypothetical protein